MARLPDVQSLGAPVTPEARGPIATIARPGLAEAVQGEEAMRGVGETAKMLSDAGERIMAKDDDIKYLGALRDFRDKADAKTRDFLMSGNIADPDAAKLHNEEITKLEQETIGSFTGRDQARIKLSGQLQNLRFGLVSGVANKSAEAQQKRVLDAVTVNRNEIAGEMFSTNDYEGAVAKHEKFIDERPSLNADVKAALKRESRGELAEQYATRLLLRGEKDAALALFRDTARDMNEARRDRLVQAFDASGKTTRVLTPAEKAQIGLPDDIVAERKSDGSTHIVYNPEKDVKIRDQKITALADKLVQTNPNLSPEEAVSEATGMIDGQISVEVNPVTGKVLKIDRRNQSVTEVPISAGGQPVPSQENKPVSLYEAVGQGGVAGVTGLGQEVIGKTLGQLSDAFVAEEVIARRKDFEMAQNDFIKAFAVNPKFPVGEVERIIKETRLSPSAFNSPAAFRAELRSMDKNLRVRLANEEAVKNDPNASPEHRANAAKAARDVKNFLDRLGVPQTKEGLPPGIPSGAVKIGTTKSGKPVYQVPGGTKRYTVD